MEIEGWSQTLGAAPLLAIAAGAIALILVLVIRFKLHAFLTLVLVSLLTAFATGIPSGSIVDVMLDGFGGLAGLQSRLTEGALLITRELGRTTVTLSMGRP